MSKKSEKIQKHPADTLLSAPETPHLPVTGVFLTFSGHFSMHKTAIFPI
jgi:hypothetical protein